MKFYRFLCIFALITPLTAGLWAQNPPQDKEKQEKQLLEYIDKEVERLSTLLDLEYWQEFYVDSILTHNLAALTDELEQLQKAKVENMDLYQEVQDKWAENTDKAYNAVFSEEQWKKYMKSGGARAKKARDKRKK
ncbi:MAG: hypothetical protein II171_00020 [Bacteroidales bacterium]|nr:hypothetical protein [Bacteroidales bacterium]